MTEDDVTSLSMELEELIRTLYVPEDQSDVRSALLEYDVSGPEVDRVRFDLLHLGAGDAARVRQLAELARRDPRDVMSQEYFWRAGRTYPHGWARRHSVNRDIPEPPRLNAAMVATARLSFQRRDSGIDRMPEQLVGGSKPRSLFLAFSDAGRLQVFAGQMLALAGDGGVLDLSTALEYRWDRNAPERTVLRCLRSKDSEKLIYEGDELSWNGTAEYWKECSVRVVELGKNSDASRISMMRDTAMRDIAGQRVLIGFRPSTSEPRTYKNWY